MSTVANLVYYYRKQSGLSQRELARLAGVGKTVIYDIEKGKASIRLHTLLKVLNILNIQMKFKTPYPQIKDNNL